MNTNYNTIMEEMINNIEGKPKLLLHACCGICSSSVLEKLHPYFDITILYYNPNIYPESEYIKRLNTLKELIEKMKLNIKVKEIGYNDFEFNEIAKGLEDEKEGEARCIKCFNLRLDTSAKYAKENNYDYFCTTLSVSPHKNSQILNNLGKQISEKYNIKYLFSDFKKKEGYKRSNEISKSLGLYRQDYCGCKYSLGINN